MLTVKIQGFNKIVKGLKKSPEISVKELGKALGKSMVVTHRQAIKEAPVNKQGGGGNLRQNIKQNRINKLRGEVDSRAKYSGYVHEGTAPHIIRVKTKQVLANRRANKIFGKVVRHPGTRANPFMQRALKKSETTINNFFQTALNNIAKKTLK